MNNDENFEGHYIDPIDIAESLAESHEWIYERYEDYISINPIGMWHQYSITFASDNSKLLKVVCIAEMTPQSNHSPEIYEFVNQVNDLGFTSYFVYWKKNKTISCRYGLLPHNDDPATTEQIEVMICNIVELFDQFYPGFLEVLSGEKSAREAIKMCIGAPVGRA